MRVVIAIVILVVSVLLIVGGFFPGMKSLLAGEKVVKSIVLIVLPFVGLYGSIAVLRRLDYGHLCCIAFLLAAAALQISNAPTWAAVSTEIWIRSVSMVGCACFMAWDLLYGLKLEAEQENKKKT